MEISPLNIKQRSCTNSIFKVYAYRIMKSIADGGFNAITNCCYTVFVEQGILYLFKCFSKPLQYRWYGLCRSYPFRNTTYVKNVLLV